MICTYETLDEHYATGLPSVTPKQWFVELTEDDEPEINPNYAIENPKIARSYKLN